MNFINELLTWGNSGTRPNANLLAEGFQVGYKPPAAYFNYMFYLLFEAGKELQNLLSAVDDNAHYTNAALTPTAIGGIAKGTTFNNTPVRDILANILYPYIAPVISTNNSTSYYEYGNTTSISSSVSVQVKKGSQSVTDFIIETPTSQTSNADHVTALNKLSSETSTTLSCSFSLTPNGTSNSAVTIHVTDSTKDTEKVVKTYSPVYAYYYGVVNSADDLTESTIKTLTKRIEAKGEKTYSFTANNQHPVFAYPSTYGALSKVTDKNGFNVTGTFTRKTVSITNAYNKTTDYYVYYLTEATTVSEFNYKFTI